MEVLGWLIALGLGGVSLLVVYAAVAVSPLELLYLPPTVVACVLVARSAMMRVDVLPEGVETANLFKTIRVPWSDFSGFSVGAWRGWKCRALINRRTGKPVPIGVLVVSPMYYDTRIESAVQELEVLIGMHPSTS